MGLAVITFPIGFVLSYVILGLLFYAIIAPIGLLLRLFGKDPLDRNIRLAPSFPPLEEVREATRALTLCIRLAAAS